MHEHDCRCSYVHGKYTEVISCIFSGVAKVKILGSLG